MNGLAWVIAGIGIIFLTLGLPHLRRRTGIGRPGPVPRPPRPEPSEADAVSSEAREVLDETLVRATEFMREAHARMDTKVRILNHLLAEVEQAKKDLDLRLEEARRLGAAAVARQAPPARPPATPPAEIPPLRDPLPPPQRDRVFTLADRGLTHQQISMETGIQRGEVELMLQTRKMGA